MITCSLLGVLKQVVASAKPSLHKEKLYTKHLKSQPRTLVLSSSSDKIKTQLQTPAWGLGFRVWGLEFGVWGLGFGVWGLGFGV